MPRKKQKFTIEDIESMLDDYANKSDTAEALTFAQSFKEYLRLKEKERAHSAVHASINHSLLACGRKPKKGLLHTPYFEFVTCRACIEMIKPQLNFK